MTTPNRYAIAENSLQRLIFGKSPPNQNHILIMVLLCQFSLSFRFLLTCIIGA